MKLSTRKAIGVGVGVTLLWVALGFVSNAIVREYLQLGVLCGGILASWWLLGWARPRAREGKLATLLLILIALLFQIATFVFFGLKLGFVYNVYGWNFDSILKVFLPMILMVVLSEIWRGQLIAKGHESQAVLIVTTLALVAIEVIWMWPMYDLAQAQDGFELVMLVGFPALLKSVMLTYIAYRFDYRANIVYRLLMELPMYLLPILPNVNQYLSTMFQVGLVLILMVVLTRLHQQTEIQKQELEPEEVEKMSQQVWRKCLKVGGALIVLVVVAGYVMLMSGLFTHYFLAVGSGSMAPNLNRGDMVLVRKSDDYAEMEEGEILVYRRDGKVLVHRIEEATEDNGKFTFVTKGDANDAADNWVVEQDDIIGIAKTKIAAFGFPTLWLNELFNGGQS